MQLILGLESLLEADLEILSLARWSKKREVTKMPEMIQLLSFYFLFRFCSIGKYVLVTAASTPASCGAGELLSVTFYPSISLEWPQLGCREQGSRVLPLAFLWTLAGRFPVVTASPSLGCRRNL